MAVRRNLFLLASLALGALTLVLLAGFMWPDLDSEVDLGRVEAFPPGSVTSFYLLPGADEVVPYRHNEQMGVGSYRSQDCRIAGTIIHLVRLADGSFLALLGRSPHLGQAVVWRPDLALEGEYGWFRDPCQNSTFAIDGRRVFGPASRDLDRFGLRIEDGRVYVDLQDVTEGYREPQPEHTPEPPGWTPQPTALATPSMAP